MFELDDDDDEAEENENDDEDGTELDSLDDGLHAFRAPSLVDESSVQWDRDPELGQDEDRDRDQDQDQGTPAMLPTHDGLGSFQASSQTVQGQLWQHEQYNPHRQRPEIRLRRQSSVQRHLDMVAEQEQMTNGERERWQRIEKWRMEQSRALLQEVERETRRRRRRNSHASRSDRTSTYYRTPSESLMSVPETFNSRPASLSSSSSQATEPGTEEPFWRRITRKVIRDLIGIDDSVLSVIFGESLPDEALDGENGYSDNGSSTRVGNATLDINEAIRRELDPSMPDDQNRWQTKLLRRIAHELGVLVHQFCEQPGAFTTYLNMTNDVSNQYAGIPLNRPAEDDTQARSVRTTAPSTTVETANDTVSSPHFSPTLPEPSGREHAAQWGIEDDDRLGDELESARLQEEKDYWERDLDIMMVFRYLRNRFSGNNASGSSSSSDSSATTPSHSRRQSQDASRRAAIIRQHHPLVARAQSRSQTQHTRYQSQPSATGSTFLRQNFRRPSSSCASHSAKQSTISSRRTMTGSSRNYWDIGGSESGSAIAPVGGGMGWGDV